MQYNICTNFYSNYLYRCLPQYYSLEKTSKSFTWWVLCMDERAYRLIKSLKLKHARPIRLAEIENPELFEAKKDRNKGEYSWTLKPFLIEYLFKKNKGIKNILYLDGDIYFFNNIALVWQDIDKNSLAIAPHRFPKNLKGREKQTGIFNAGVIYFKRDKEALKALARWKRQCIKWCYWRLEDGKLGDQMYLNEWPRRYKNLHQFSHKGINLAPWNVNEYKITTRNKKIFIDKDPLVFYHFHQFKINEDLTFNKSFGYTINKNSTELIYSVYEKEILRVIEKVKSVDKDFRDGLESKLTKGRLKNFIYSTLLPYYWSLMKFASKNN